MSVFTVFPWSSIVSKLAHHCTRIQQNKKKVTRTTKHDHHKHKKGHPRRLARAHSGRIRCRGMDGAEDVPKHVSPVPRLHTRTLRDAHFCTYASTHARTHARTQRFRTRSANFFAHASAQHNTCVRVCCCHLILPFPLAPLRSTRTTTNESQGCFEIWVRGTFFWW